MLSLFGKSARPETTGVDAEENPLHRGAGMAPVPGASRVPVGFFSSNPASAVEMPAPIRGGGGILLRDSFLISSLVVAIDSESPLKGKTGQIVGIVEKASSADTGWVVVPLEHGNGNDGDTGLIKFQPQHILAPGSFFC